MSYPTGYSSRSDTSGLIDLRSDTVTRPDAEMRAVMAQAEVGDDVYGDDPGVQALEEHAAELFGKEAAAFFPTGTQSNLAALLTHCQRGDEVLVGRGYHIQSAEAAGASVLGGIALDPLPLRADFGLDAAVIREAVKPDDSHFARSRLLCLENTVGGRVVPLEVQDDAISVAAEMGLVCHLDGARALNACVALDVGPARIARGFSTVSVCLSKGLGAPAGSVLCGDAARIATAKRWRKMLGGGMRQSGILAAAGLHALRRNLPDLAEDHRRAQLLAQELEKLPSMEVNLSDVQTNMIWAKSHGLSDDDLMAQMIERGILLSPSDGGLRLVLHRDVDDNAVSVIIASFRALFDRTYKTGTAA